MSDQDYVDFTRSKLSWPRIDIPEISSPMYHTRDDKARIFEALRLRPPEPAPAGSGIFNRVMIQISLAAGSAFIVVGGWLVHRFHADEFMFDRATAQGEVVEYTPVDIPSSITEQFPGGPLSRAMVRFRTHDGTDVTFGDWIVWDTPSFRVGQSVGVFYDPREPEHAMIDRGWKNYLAPGIPGAM